MITKDMKILDIVSKYPETQKVFPKFDNVASICIMCNHLFDSIEDISKKYEININELIFSLNEKINTK